jgi:acetate kinase
VLHLGNGASITAIDGGHSVDTSMGLTPLKASSWARARATSTRRCCSCSRRREDMTPGQLDEFLNKRSGMLGLAGV